MGQFYYSAKAFDVLERLDPNPEYWEGKRGACVGIFQLILAGRETRSGFHDLLMLLYCDFKLLNLTLSDECCVIRLLFSSFRESLKEVFPMLRSTGNPQVEYIIRIMKKWAKENRVAL